MVVRERKEEIACRILKSGTSQWTHDAEEWAEQNGGGNRLQRMHKDIHNLAKLSVFFEVRRSSFRRHSNICAA